MRGTSLRMRAILALALMIGFYLLALTIAGGLLYIPYAEWVFAGHFTARIAIFCVLGAGAILQGIVPRVDRFVPPGPRLLPDEQPRLFALVRDVAAATNQAMPSEIYLAADVNAFVTERGGVMGFGSRRVMGIGLPLVSSLTIAECRAVVAHEFGHYVGGDTKLGPWIYKTRAAIFRTLQELGKRSQLIAKPFEWYGLGFLRITHAVSRRQEFVADAVAARVAGAATMMAALRSIERAGVAYRSFWSTELGGVLERGYRAPIVVGFQQFITAANVATQLDAYLERSIKHGKSAPYDTHPSLKERFAALQSLPQSAVTTSAMYNGDVDGGAAVTLLADVGPLEAALLDPFAKGRALVPIEWDAVPSTVLPVGWKALARASRQELASLTASELPGLARQVRAQPQALADRLGIPSGSSSETVEAASARAAHAAGIVGSALALALLERSKQTDSGVVLSAPPGAPVVFQLPGGSAPATIEPFSVLASLGDGSLDSETWRLQCAAAGIDAMSLAPADDGTDGLPLKEKVRWR